MDKLESIPGLRTAFSQQEFFDIVNRTGICVAGQSGNLAPADKKIYALRDVTATVDSIPLIASSIMSKKLAAGSDCILLDVKTGSGAFMKTLEDSVCLAEKMVAIGEPGREKNGGTDHKYGYSSWKLYWKFAGGHGSCGDAPGRGTGGSDGSVFASGGGYVILGG